MTEQFSKLSGCRTLGGVEQTLSMCKNLHFHLGQSLRSVSSAAVNPLSWVVLVQKEALLAGSSADVTPGHGVGERKSLIHFHNETFCYFVSVLKYCDL